MNNIITTTGAFNAVCASIGADEHGVVEQHDGGIVAVVVTTAEGIGVDVGGSTNSTAQGFLEALNLSGLVNAEEYAAWKTGLS